MTATRNLRALILLILLPIALLGACGGDSSSKGSGTAGSATSPEMSMQGATMVGQGSAAGGPESTKSDAAVAPAPSGVAGAGAGGTSGGGAGGSAGSATGGSGNAGGGGSSGSASGGSVDAGGGDAGCTRELLSSTIEAYFKALAAHDPSSLALADDVKLTENGKVATLGAEGLWKTAGAVKYAHSALDPETCSSASQAVVPDGTTDIPVALRLKLGNQKITEIETIAVRSGDYKVAGQSFASNTAALIASGSTVKWEERVPADQRSSRADLVGWMDKYFRMFPRGVCNTTSDCKRIENGGGSFGCSAGASCDPGPPSADRSALVPRLVFADVETGVGVGFTMFMGNTDMHMFKMYGGEVHGVSAILGAASGSGWD